MQQLHLQEPPPKMAAFSMPRKVQIYGISNTQYQQLEELSQTELGKKSVSEIIKKIVGLYLQQKNGTQSEKVRYSPKKTEKEERCRLEIKLSAAEYQYLQQMAEIHETTANQIVAHQVKNLIDEYPVLSVAELNAVRLSNIRLQQIGRNINQIAKHLNAIDGTSFTTQQISAISKLITDHSEKIADLICESKKRYQHSK